MTHPSTGGGSCASVSAMPRRWGDRQPHPGSPHGFGMRVHTRNAGCPPDLAGGRDFESRVERGTTGGRNVAGNTLPRPRGRRWWMKQCGIHNQHPIEWWFASGVARFREGTRGNPGPLLRGFLGPFPSRLNQSCLTWSIGGLLHGRLKADGLDICEKTRVSRCPGYSAASFPPRPLPSESFASWIQRRISLSSFGPREFHAATSETPTPPHYRLCGGIRPTKVGARGGGLTAGSG
jgi:hypothetical protein